MKRYPHHAPPNEIVSAPSRLFHGYVYLPHDYHTNFELFLVEHYVKIPIIFAALSSIKRPDHFVASLIILL